MIDQHTARSWCKELNCDSDSRQLNINQKSKTVLHMDTTWDFYWYTFFPEAYLRLPVVFGIRKHSAVELQTLSQQKQQIKNVNQQTMSPKLTVFLRLDQTYLCIEKASFNWCRTKLTKLKLLCFKIRQGQNSFFCSKLCVVTNTVTKIQVWIKATSIARAKSDWRTQFDFNLQENRFQLSGGVKHSIMFKCRQRRVQTHISTAIWEKLKK